MRPVLEQSGLLSAVENRNRNYDQGNQYHHILFTKHCYALLGAAALAAAAGSNSLKTSFRAAINSIRLLGGSESTSAFILPSNCAASRFRSNRFMVPSLAWPPAAASAMTM
jgi:hypothetical protein